MKTSGRPTKLDAMLFRKIRELVIDGNNLREIAEILEIPYATMRDWEYENYESFSDKMLSYKHERMLRKAETNIEVLQESEDEKVNLQANALVLETLGKKHYSKRIDTDVTTKGKSINQYKPVKEMSPEEVDQYLKAQINASA